MSKKINVLYATSEIAPYAKVGGLGDVSASLTNALNSAVSIRLVTPNYQAIKKSLNSTKTVLKDVDMLGYEGVNVIEGKLPEIKPKVYVVDHPAFTESATPYVDKDHHPLQDLQQRYALFSKAVALLANKLQSSRWAPQIIHCNDWHTSLTPLYTKELQAPTKTIFTIHNLRYQGMMEKEQFTTLDLPEHYNSFDQLEFHNRINPMKGALLYSDYVTTVSPQYAQEICSPTHGCGLEGVLHYRKNAPVGIINGIDDKTWNPKKDHHISQKYDQKSITKKVNNRKELLKTTQLKTSRTDTTILGVVSRFVPEKGIDLIIKELEYFLYENTTLVMVFAPNPEAEAQAQELQKQYPDRLKIIFKFDETLAHQIIAGSDILLVPSYTEPCGLTQLYAQRYGTIPFVRGVGGLLNTVHPFHQSENDTHGTGFVFYDDFQFTQQLLDAIEVHQNNPDAWTQLQHNAMDQDFSWKQSSEKYANLYQLVLE